MTTEWEHNGGDLALSVAHVFVYTWNLTTVTVVPRDVLDFPSPALSVAAIWYAHIALA